MRYRPVLNRDVLIPLAAVLALVLLAVSPRSLLAPALSFNRAQESKRPKAPKNIVRTDPSHASNSERPGKGPRPSPSRATPHESHDLQARVTFGGRIAARATGDRTQPPYLKPGDGSPPHASLAPPV